MGRIKISPMYYDFTQLYTITQFIGHILRDMGRRTTRNIKKQLYKSQTKSSEILQNTVQLIFDKEKSFGLILSIKIFSTRVQMQTAICI